MSKQKQEVPDNFMDDFLAGKTQEQAATGAIGAESETIALSATSTTLAPTAIGATSAIFKKHGMEIRAEYLENLKTLAYWRRVRLRDLLDEALREYLQDKEIEQRPGEQL
jgi:hypothetical protein